MKIEPIFELKENKIVRKSDNTFFDLNDFQQIQVLWSQIELEPECYNEMFLAQLRENLKSLEPNNFAFIEPKIDKKIENFEQIELFINACNHTARRIKDCISVVGFVIPKDFEQKQEFMEVLSKKHSHYIFL